MFVCEMYRYSCKDIQQTENIQYDCIHPHVVHTPESKEKSNPMNKTTKENRQQQNNTPETTKQHDNTIDIGVWAVFDGHEGDDVSKWLSQNMEQMLMENIQKKPPTTITQMKNLIIRTFCRLDARIACHQSGTDDLVRAQHHTKGLVDARSEVKKEEEEEDKELEEAGSTAAVVLLYVSMSVSFCFLPSFSLLFFQVPWSFVRGTCGGLTCDCRTSQNRQHHT